jgi:hypothetical protein
MTIILNGYKNLKFENNPLYYLFKSERILKQLVSFNPFFFHPNFKFYFVLNFHHT